MRTGMMTPGDIGTLTEEMEHLGTQDYMGAKSELLLRVVEECADIGYSLEGN
jgi:DNA-directed RNA polymerase beta' subunit